MSVFDILARGTDEQAKRTFEVLGEAPLYARRYTKEKAVSFTNKDILDPEFLALMFVAGKHVEAAQYIRVYYDEAKRPDATEYDPLYAAIYALTAAGKLDAAIDAVSMAQELWAYRNKIYSQKQFGKVLCTDCRAPDDPVADLVKALFIAGEPEKAKKVACQQALGATGDRSCHRDEIGIWEFYSGIPQQQPESFVSSDVLYAKQRLEQSNAKLSESDNSGLLNLMNEYVRAGDLARFGLAVEKLGKRSPKSFNKKYGLSYRPSVPLHSQIMQAMMSNVGFDTFLSKVWPYYLASCMGEYGRCVEEHCGTEGGEALPDLQSVYAQCVAATLDAQPLRYSLVRSEKFRHLYPWPPAPKK